MCEGDNTEHSQSNLVPTNPHISKQDFGSANAPSRINMMRNTSTFSNFLELAPNKQGS